MRALWNGLSRKSRLGYISHLRSGEWDQDEFAVVGDRFVARMVERFSDYGTTPINDASILEIGCGVGRFLRPLAARFKRVIGVDISPEMLGVAKAYCGGCPNVELHVTDGSSLRMIPDESLDYCVSAGVFQHITDQRVILDYVKEATRVLKPGGVFLFQFEGNRTDPVGIGQVGARITASDLDSQLRGVPFTFR